MKKILQIVIAVIAFTFVLYIMSHNFSLRDILNIVKSLSPLFIATVILFSLVISLVKATRFFTILRFNNIPVSWVKTVQTFKATEVFTPLPAGEVARAVLFKKRLNVKIDQVAVPVFLQAIIEIWSAAFVVFILSFITHKHDWPLILVVAIILFLVTLPLIIPKKIYLFLEYIKSKGLKYEWVSQLIEVMKSTESFFRKRVTQSRLKFWLIIIFLGLSSQFLGGLLIWYIARAQNVGITLVQGAVSASVATLIQGVLSVIPGGLGVTEGGLAAVLRSFSIPWNNALSVTLIYRLITLPLSIIIGLTALLSIYVPKFVKEKYK